MGEFGYMDDAVNDIESGVYTFYLYMSNESDTLNKRVADISNYFPTLTKEEIEKIIVEKTNNDFTNIVLSNFDYLNTLSTKELDGIYAVLIRQGKNNSNDETVKNIEQIVCERDVNKTIDIFRQVSNEILNFNKYAEIEKWNSFELDFSTEYKDRENIYREIKTNIDNHKEIGGFYAIFKDNKCLYIGIGKRIWERIKSHYKASKGEDKSKKWSDFFSKHQSVLKIYWFEYKGLENPKQSHKLREIIENILELKYEPEFERKNAPQHYVGEYGG